MKGYAPSSCANCGGPIMIPRKFAHEGWWSGWVHKYGEDCMAELRAQARRAEQQPRPSSLPRCGGWRHEPPG